MSEKPILNLILLNLSKTSVLFRNNTGKGWVGRLISSKFGTVVIENARPLNAGLVKGSSDLIGWTSIEVTPEMVGKKIAVFSAIEAKTGKTSTSPEQANFIEQITQAGGIAFVCHTDIEAREKLNEWIAKLKTSNKA
jgi:hypothetical protein